MQTHHRETQAEIILEHFLLWGKCAEPCIAAIIYPYHFLKKYNNNTWHILLVSSPDCCFFIKSKT